MMFHPTNLIWLISTSDRQNKNTHRINHLRMTFNKRLIILLAHVLTNNTCGAENVFQNGRYCKLKGEITCNIGAKNGKECKTMGLFDQSKCKTDIDRSFTAVYTMTFENKNPEGNHIKFLTEINAESEKENPYSFGRANLKDADIRVHQKLRAGVKKSFEVTRIIDPCGTRGEVPTERFVSELQLTGHVIGHKGDVDYSCYSHDFYSHYFQHFDPPTMSPTMSPTESPTVTETVIHTNILPTTPAPTKAPTPVPVGKGKGKARKRT